MTMVIPSPVTGATMPGFTSPTYTLIDDQAPANQRRWIISALGGTQVGATAHTASQQFAIEVERPAVIRQLGAIPLTGQLQNVPVNKYKIRTLKGVIPAANQLPRGMIIRTEVVIPAGSETYDAANVKAAIAAHLGALYAQSSGLWNTAATGVI